MMKFALCFIMKQIAILTDFGSRDNYNGVMEAVIRRINPKSTVSYISPESREFNIYAGAYLLLTSYRYFTRGTVFLVVIDPGVGTDRRPILVRTRRFYFIGPDNGVLYPAVQEDEVKGVWVLDNPKLFRKTELSSTFHGRDIFAPSAALKAAGVSENTLGTSTDPSTMVKLNLPYIRTKEEACGVVFYIDHFGNIALSIREAPPSQKVKVKMGDFSGQLRLVRTFGDGEPGELILYKNSYGFMEVGINKGNANKVINIREGENVCLGGYTQGDSSHSILAT